MVLVLDDYHVIDAPACHDQIAFLLTHLPPAAQLVIVTRTDPPLGLARLRAVGEMTEIRAADLRFGPGATAALVRGVAGAAPSDVDVASLVQRTEGWPAGLYSAWHQVWGSAEEAIRHSLAAGDADTAVGLVAEHWHSYVDSGRMATVSGWLHALGEARIAASPLAAHSAMWLAALSGDQRSARRWLSVVAAAGDQGPLPDGMRSCAFSAALMQATFGFDGIGAARRAGAVAVQLEADPRSPWYALARVVFAQALYFSGQPELAAAEPDEAGQAGAPLALARMLAAVVSAWLAIDTGRVDDAGTEAQRARDIVTDPVIGLSGAPQSSLAYIATGAAAAARGQLGEARGEFETALRIRRKWAGISPVPTVELLLRYAPVLADLGDHAAAGALVAETRELLGALPDGAEAQLARLDAVERRVGGRPRRNGQNGLSSWNGPAEPLTGREQAVLRLLTGTLSLREIANVMYVSPNTVKTHTQAVYRKLGVSDRKDAVARGRDLGLL